MLRKATAILFLGVSALVFAQSDAEWYLDKPIRAIEFVGLEDISENELEAIVEPFVGEDFSEQRFLELQRRLYALDYFEQIIPNAVRADGSENAVIIRFEVVERPVITDIEIEGNNRLGRNRILDVTLLKRGDMVTRSKLRIDEEAIRTLYLEQGFPDVIVSSEFIENEEDEENIVRFIVDEGNQISIESIVFVGNNFATDSTLQGEMQLREQNLFNKGLFNAARLEQDRNRIRRYYNEFGFIDAEVVETEQTLREDEERDRSFMTITLYIEEGQQYSYGGVTFDGNTIFTDEELADLIRLEEGEILDLNTFDADYQRVADRYYEDGYIFNEIRRNEVRDEEERVVSFAISIVERNRAHIENVIFRGNEKTRDYVIEREVPLEVGDVFSATKIREGLRNLANLQYFSAITPETPPGSADGLMDLIINLEESSTADITFGLAFGGNQEYPVSAQIQWQDRNFLGRGQTFGIQGIASPINQQISFNFLERWLFGRRWSGGLNLLFERSIVDNVPQDAIAPIYADEDDDAVPDPFSADDYVFTEDGTIHDGREFDAGDRFPGIPTSDQINDLNLQTEWDYLGGSNANIPDENLMSYEAYAIRLAANTGYTFRTPVGRLIPRTTIATSINYITYDDTLFRPADSTTRENLDTWRFKNSWTLGAALDNRDFIFSPSSGYRLDQSITFVGGWLSGQRHYSQTRSLAEVFFTLWDVPVGEWSWKMVLGMQSELSFILPNFYLNERDDRYFDAVSATDLLRINGFFNARGWPFESGGSALWNNWIELRMPLAEQVIWWDTFFEMATLRGFDNDEVWNTRERLNDLEWQDWKFTIGSGIRFVIPQFPIRLYLAKRFQVGPDGEIDWQQGNLFSGDDENAGLDLVFSIGAEFF